VNYGHTKAQLAWILLYKTFLIRIPTSIFQKQTPNINTFFRMMYNLFRLYPILNFEFEIQPVDRFLVLTSISLEYASDKAMREEKAGKPKTFGMSTSRPLCHKLNSLFKIFDPRYQSLKARI
jgi:hypothetical protein